MTGYRVDTLPLFTQGDGDQTDRTIRDWIESTEESITALQCWRDALIEWEQHGGELQDGDFATAYRRLCRIIGDGWGDDNPCNIDALAEVVTGERP